MLDAKIASALRKVITNSYFNKSVNLVEQKAQMQDRLLRRRQIAFMIYEYFRVTGAHDAVLDYSELFRITYMATVFKSWIRDQAPVSTKEVPQDSILESLYKMRVREFDQLRTVMAMYEQEINHDRS